MRHREIKLPWHLAGIVIGIIAIIFVTAQSQQAYTTAKETALQVQACQKEFNQTLRDRARITAENDEISQSQRKIVFDWIHDLIFPPQPYASMDTNDRRRQDYGITITIDTANRFQRSFDRQSELQAERDRHPLPDPTCGK